eukprot:UN24537
MLFEEDLENTIEYIPNLFKSLDVQKQYILSEDTPTHIQHSLFLLFEYLNIKESPNNKTSYKPGRGITEPFSDTFKSILKKIKKKAPKEIKQKKKVRKEDTEPVEEYGPVLPAPPPKAIGPSVANKSEIGPTMPPKQQNDPNPNDIDTEANKQIKGPMKPTAAELN